MKLMYPRTDSSRLDNTLRNKKIKVNAQVLQCAAIDESLRIKYVTINRMFRSITIFYLDTIIIIIIIIIIIMIIIAIIELDD